jgi:hypothetical protein
MAKKHPKELQEEMIELFKKGESASSIARKLNLYTTSVTRVLKRNGLKMPSGKGEEHSQWKGGRGIKSGYWTVYNPNHPRALNIRRVWEHILVLEKHIGRYIDKSEPIHHIDMNRLNNKIENLYLCKNHSEHQQLHSSLDKVVSNLIKNKTIKFKDGRYYL